MTDVTSFTVTDDGIAAGELVECFNPGCGSDAGGAENQIGRMWDRWSLGQIAPCPRTIPNRLNALARMLGQLGQDNRLGQVARCHNRHRGLDDGREAMAMMLYRAREDRYDRLRNAGARQSSSRGLPAAGRWCCSDIFPWPTGEGVARPRLG